MDTGYRVSASLFLILPMACLCFVCRRWRYRGWRAGFGKLLSPRHSPKVQLWMNRRNNLRVLNACMIQRWFRPSLHSHKTSNLFTRGWRAETLFWQNELAAFHWPVTPGDNIELDWELIPLIINNVSWLFFSAGVLIKLLGPSVFKECEYLT